MISGVSVVGYNEDYSRLEFYDDYGDKIGTAEIATSALENFVYALDPSGLTWCVMSAWPIWIDEWDRAKYAECID